LIGALDLTKNNKLQKVLVLNRESLVASKEISLSTSTRVKEVLDFLVYKKHLEYIEVFDSNPIAKRAIDWSNVMILSKHRSVKSLELVKYAKQKKKIVIYDLDDWIFSFPNISQGSKIYTENYALDILKYCDFITVANSEILKRTKSILPNRDVKLLPNGMWIDRLTHPSNIKYSTKAKEKKIVFSNTDNLKIDNSKQSFLEALQFFFFKNPEYILDFYGDPFPEIFSLPFLHFCNRISYQQYMKIILSGNYEFAVIPLGSNEEPQNVEFNDCKNPFKYINYGAAKVPGIYSDSKIYKDNIKNEVTGLLVKNEYDDWYKAMNDLSKDKYLQKKIREEAFRDVCKRFNIYQPAKILLSLIFAI
tara:strand:- start:181 stop:1266 length:1086 start_codon:yes stop_codon:yes gene_type:complete